MKFWFHEVEGQTRQLPCVFMSFLLNISAMIGRYQRWYTSRSVIIMFINNRSPLNRWYSWWMHDKSGSKNETRFSNLPGCPNRSRLNQLYSSERKLIPTDNWSSIWIKVILAMKSVSIRYFWILAVIFDSCQHIDTCTGQIGAFGLGPLAQDFYYCFVGVNARTTGWYIKLCLN